MTVLSGVDRRTYRFFAAYLQSSIGTGAGYVALLLLAYDRFASPWAISLVLLADVVPPMALGPLFGAAADRWPRRACLVTADLARAAAFVGIALVPSFGATAGLALAAGMGNGLFTPAALAGLPGLVGARRLPTATSLYGAIAEVGYILGPAAAAAMLLVAGPEDIMLLNAATFALSAAVLARVRFASVAAGGRHARSLIGEASDGVRAAWAMRTVRIVVLASSAALLCGGLFNVGELLLATDDLGAGSAGFSMLVAAFGLGVLAGSLAGAAGGDAQRLKRRYLVGLLLSGVGLLVCAAATSVGPALAGFAVAGYGNGAMLVHGRLIIQTSVPDRLLGRVFGVKDALTAWAFTGAFVVAGGLLSAIGPRSTILVAGVGALTVWVVTATALSDARRPARRPAALRGPLEGAVPGEVGARQHRSDRIHRR